MTWFCSLLENSEGCAAWVSAIVALAALALVPREYYNQRRQHQLETALGLIDQLRTEEMLSFAVTTLDWGTGKIPAPQLWKSVIDEPVVWNWQVIHDATRPQITQPTVDDVTRLLYRHSFVALFNHLERMGELLERGVINVEDLRSLSWVCQQLVSWDYAPPPLQNGYFDETLQLWYPGGGPQNLIRAVTARWPKSAGESAA